jgi:hypothetical protein
LANFECTFTGYFALAAMDTVVKIDPHGITLLVVTDHIGWAILNDKIFEGKIEFFFAEDGLCIIFRESAIFNSGIFRFSIDSQFNSMSGTSLYTNAAVNTLFLVNIYGCSLQDVPVF